MATIAERELTSRTPKPEKAPNLKEETVRVTRESGNVFADIGLPDAEELLAKSKLVSALSQVMDSRKLDVKKTAALLEMDASALNRLIDGALDEFSVHRLIEMLNGLGQNVEISIRPKPADADKARTTISIAHVL